MKKLVALLLAVCMVACLFAGCSDDAAEETTATEATQGDETVVTEGTEATDPAPAPSSDYRVAMVTDYGDITDQSFNQATYEGAKAWCDENGVDFTYYKPTGDSTAERVASVEQAIDEGYNVLVLPGYAFGGTIVETCESYPDVKFIALDVAAGDILETAVTLAGEEYTYNPADYNIADYVDLSNVYCAVYQEELAGYMAGYAAVKLGYTKLGFLGGMAVPAVVRYGYGFVQGADAAAVELGNAADVTMKYAYGNQFYGDADITAAMDTWYNDDTEIVFACGGGIWSSAAEAAAKVGQKVIGVDVDQAATIDGAYGAGMTVTSAMKGLSATVKTMLTEIITNDNWAAYAGTIETLGLVSGDDTTLNYVQLPVESTQWADGFTADDYVALVAELFGGARTVSNDISAEPATTIAVDYQGNIK